MDATAPIMEETRSAATAAPTTRVPLRALELPALTSAVLLWLCHFPVAWGWLGWVALAPLLTLVRQPVSVRRTLLAAWLAGLLFFGAALQWLRVADSRMYATWAGLALYCSFYFPLAIGLLRFVDRRTRLPLVVSVPLVWTSLEYLRTYLFTGFPWYFLGHTQHDFTALIQIADMTGAYGVTFVVAAVNAIVFELVWGWTAKPRAAFPTAQAAGVVGLVVVCLIYGWIRLSQVEFQPGPRVALIQSNQSQAIRNNSSADPGDEMLTQNSRLCSRAVDQKPDLIVWPETSYPGYWVEVPPGAPATPEQRQAAEECRIVARDVSRSWPTNVLLGMNSEIVAADGKSRLYNSAILIAPPGQAVARYDKVHRVPFGEYVPLRDWFPWLNAFAPYDFDYSISVGDAFTRFSLAKHRFGVVICYEDSDPSLARQYATDVDFLVNISNDGWFNGTSEHEEHLAICRFRAVECRRPVLRAVNMGISAVIDSNGGVLQPELIKSYPGIQVWEATASQTLPVSRWSEFKQVAGVLIGTVPLDTRHSCYAKHGDWFAALCAVFLGVAVTSGLLRKRTG